MGTTQMILPAYSWQRVGYKGKDLQPGDLKTVFVAGCDICVGKTASGKLFCLGDKLPPTGISLSVGGEVVGEKVKEAQYGNIFDPFTGQPEGAWCPEPPDWRICRHLHGRRISSCHLRDQTKFSWWRYRGSHRHQC